MLAGIVHEINTPIGSIFSNNEVTLRSLEMLSGLLEEPQKSGLEKARKILETLHSLAGVDKIACERIGSVIRGLKTFARVDSSECRKVDLNENLRSTLKLTQAEFRRGRQITVETDFGELPEMECYPHMLNQVFLNLLVNAGQAIEGEGRITVRTRQEGSRGAHLHSGHGAGHAARRAAAHLLAGIHHQARRHGHRAGAVYLAADRGEARGDHRV